jgi:hypothetical protein
MWSQQDHVEGTRRVTAPHRCLARRRGGMGLGLATVGLVGVLAACGGASSGSPGVTLPPSPFATTQVTTTSSLPTSTTAHQSTTIASTTSTTLPPTTTTVPPTTTSVVVDAQGNIFSPFFLADAKTVGGTPNPEVGPVTVNGVTYPHSIFDVGSVCAVGRVTTHAYDLGRHYSTFRATLGESDKSPANAPAQWDVYADGVQVYSGKAVLGQSVPLDLSMKGVLRLELTTTLLSAKSPSCDGFALAWADAEVFP